MPTHPIQRMKTPQRQRLFGFDRTYMFVFILFIIVIGVAGYLVIMVNDYSYQAYTLNGKLTDEMGAHNLTKADLEKTVEELSNKTNIIENKTIEIGQLNTSLNSVTQMYLDVERQMENKNNTIFTLTTELAYARQGGSFLLHDPSTAEMVSFLQNDSTSNNTYNDLNYTCSYFSRDVKNHAEFKGMRCAIVLLVFNQTLGHAMVGFNTSDNGFIYIEPQNDLPQNITKGGTYWGLEIRDVLIIW